MQFKPDTHLHSREHVLADDLSQMLGEPRRFASYLGIAKLYHESDLRGLARRVVEKFDLPLEARGKYFFAALRGLPKKLGVKFSRKKKKSKKSKTKKKPNGKTRNNSKRAQSRSSKRSA